MSHHSYSPPVPPDLSRATTLTEYISALPLLLLSLRVQVREVEQAAYARGGAAASCSPDTERYLKCRSRDIEALEYYEGLADTLDQALAVLEGRVRVLVRDGWLGGGAS